MKQISQFPLQLYQSLCLGHERTHPYAQIHVSVSQEGGSFNGSVGAYGMAGVKKLE